MGFSHVIPELIKKILKIKKNNSLKLQSANHRRAFCYIDDAVNQIYLITKSKVTNETFNIGNNQEEISIINLCKKILALSFRNDIKIIKKKVNNFSPTRRLPAMNNIFRFIKKFQHTKLEDGLIKTMNWYKSN